LKFLKKSIKKRPRKKNNFSRYELICQTRNQSHVTDITLKKKIKINYEVQFSTNLLLNDEIEKKINKKQLELTQVNLPTS